MDRQGWDDPRFAQPGAPQSPPPPQWAPQSPPPPPQWTPPPPPSGWSQSPPPMGASPPSLVPVAMVAAGAALRPRPKSLNGVTLALLLALGAEAVVDVLSIVAYAWRLRVLHEIRTDASISFSSVAANDHFVKVVATLSTPVALVGLVVLLIWVHEARSNLGAFRWGPFDFSPGWAVGWFVIPIANVWLPLLVVREIWRGSDPTLPPFAPASFKFRPVSPLVGLWWATFLAAELASVVALVVSVEATTGQALSTFGASAKVHIATHLLRLTYLALTALVARAVARRQAALAGQVPQPPAWTPQPAAAPWPVTVRSVSWPDVPPSTQAR